MLPTRRTENLASTRIDITCASGPFNGCGHAAFTNSRRQYLGWYSRYEDGDVYTNPKYFKQ